MFRDQSDLALTPGLGSTISAALDGSRYFILLACPEAATSTWVNREVAHWCDTKSTDHLLLVVTGGELAWDATAGEFSVESTAVPEALRGRYAEEPLYLDLRWARHTPELSLRLSRFRAAIAQIAAPIRGLAPEELEGEDIRLHRRARALAHAAIATVAVLAIVATVAAVLAVGNARRADRRAREALGRQLGLAALDLPAADVDQAFLLSLVAADLQDDDDGGRFQASRALVGRYSRLEALLHPAAPDDAATASGISFRGVAIAPDGRIVASAWSPDGSVELLSWANDGRAQAAAVAVPAGYSPSVAFAGAGGRIVIGSSGGRVATVDGGAVAPVGDRVVALDLTAERALVVTAGGMLELVDVGRAEPVGGPIADPGGGAPDDGPLTDLSHGRAVIAGTGTMTLVDSVDGAVLASADSTPALVAVAVGPSEATAVLGASADGTLRIWRRDATALVAGDTVTTVDQIGRPRRLAPSPDGRRVLVMGDTGTALVDLSTETAESVDVGAAGVVAIDPSGRFAAIGGARLTVWDLTTGQRGFAVPEPANAMAWSGRCDADIACKLVTAGESLDVWDPTAGRRVQLADQTNAQAVAISGDGSTVVTAGWGATVARWTLAAPIDDSGRTALAPAGSLTAVDVSSGALARYDGASTVDVAADGSTASVATGPITALALVAGGTQLLVDDVDGLGGTGGLRLVAVDGGDEIDLDHRCRGDRHAVSPRGTYVVTHESSTGATVVCDTSTGQMLAGATVAGVAEPQAALAVDDDGDVAVGGGDGFVELYRVEGGRFATGVAVDVRLGGEDVVVTSLALRDGTIASGIRPTGGRTAVARVLVWDADGGGTPVQFETDHRDVAAVGLLGPRADLIVVAGTDGERTAATVQVWEADTRRRLGRALGGLAGDVVTLGGDASAVVGVDAEGRAFTWSLDADPTAEICAIVGRPLRVDEWESIAEGALRGEPYVSVCG